MENNLDTIFPFGKQLKRVQQTGTTRSGKKVFVLGIYADVVNARWIDTRGKEIVPAIPVASEPEIYWTGTGAEKTIADLSIPAELGTLEIASDEYNGVIGRTLDTLFLEPLGYTRNDAWLCNLIREPRMDESQRLVIDKRYKPVVEKFELPPATVPDFDKTETNPLGRRNDILEELEKSAADTIIVLGELPLSWFFKFYDERFSKLSDFGETNETYGKSHEITINNKVYNVVPLAHPRQVSPSTISTSKWKALHLSWAEQKGVKA